MFSTSVLIDTAFSRLLYLHIRSISFAKVVATALAVSRANMATSDWLRSFEFDRVFWSHPSGNNDDDGRSVHSSEDRTSARATQQSVYEGLGRRIVDDAMNVS